VASPGLFLDLPESKYHADDFGDGLRLSVSVAQALVLESPAHAYLRHPKLGNQPLKPTTDMDRGTLIHKLLLGKGQSVKVVECEAWTKKKDKEEREEIRSSGALPVTRKLFDEASVAAAALASKLKSRGYALTGDSEVTALWAEVATNGAHVPCRGRFDHIKGNDIFELKITGDANPKTLTRGQLTRMGYDIQGTAYPRALEYIDARAKGRSTFTMLFCEHEPPYCITAVRFAGSLRELGARKWQRAVDTWEECLRTGTWPDYSDEIVFAEARPWELADIDAESEHAA
jgi:hypothetical protein